MQLQHHLSTLIVVYKHKSRQGEMALSPTAPSISGFANQWQIPLLFEIGRFLLHSFCLFHPKCSNNDHNASGFLALLARVLPPRYCTFHHHHQHSIHVRSLAKISGIQTHAAHASATATERLPPLHLTASLVSDANVAECSGAYLSVMFDAT